MPPPHQLGIMGECCKLLQWGPGQSPGDLAIFVDFGTQEVILGDSIIQNHRLMQCSTLHRVQISVNK